MKKILVIDDSALMRRVLSDIISTDERFVVGDTARDGVEGLDYIIKNNDYDVILLDINMPRLNGLELLAELRKIKLKTPVIIVSTLVKDGADETIKALELGAFDFVLKPDSFVKTREADFKNQILERLEAATALTPKVRPAYKAEMTRFSNLIYPSQQRETRTNGRKLIVLACSTGGPKALQQVIPKLPPIIGGGMLMVQHMPEGFTHTLAKRLQDLSVIGVKEAVNGEMIVENQVYLAKGGSHLKYQEQAGMGYLTLSGEPPRGALRPCADILFESLVGTAFDKIVCVVLTGMGADGTAGIAKLKKTNNIYVIAQDEESCTVHGMPRAVKEAGLVDEIQPLDRIAEAIVKATGVK